MTMKPDRLAALLFFILFAAFCYFVAGCTATYEKGPFKVQVATTAEDFKTIKNLSR